MESDDYPLIDYVSLKLSFYKCWVLLVVFFLCTIEDTCFSKSMLYNI